MTETTGEKPFFETSGRAGRPPVARASRAPLYAATAVAFLAGAVAFFLNNRPGSLAAGSEGEGYLAGYMLGGLMVTAVIIACIGALVLSVSTARRTGQRHVGQDIAWLLSAAAGGGVAVFVLVLVVGASGPSRAERLATLSATHRQVLAADSAAFQSEFSAALGTSELISADNLRRDPGYRRTLARITAGRAVIAAHRPRFAARKAQMREELAKEAPPRARSSALAEYDAGAARTGAKIDRYWDLQVQLLDRAEALIAVLKRAPGQWQGNQYLFNRAADVKLFNDGIAAFNANVQAIESQRLEINSISRQPQ